MPPFTEFAARAHTIATRAVRKGLRVMAHNNNEPLVCCAIIAWFVFLWRAYPDGPSTHELDPCSTTWECLRRTAIHMAFLPILGPTALVSWLGRELHVRTLAIPDPPPGVTLTYLMDE